LELSLNESGLRIDSKEAQGLFNKTATAEGVSSNLGRRIWIERFGPNLVRTVRTARRGPDSPIWIGPVRSDKTRPAAGGSPEIDFRSGAPPELGDLGAPGVKTTRAWV
jgi:hypothetical protein